MAEGNGANHELPAGAGDQGSGVPAGGGADLPARVSEVIATADGIEERSELPFTFPYTEIKNLVWIENNPLYSAALKEWERKEAYLGSRVERREKSSADLTNQVYNIVGFFSVFQGVVLTAVSQLKSAKDDLCGIIKFPICLSSAAAAVAIIGIYLKFSTLEDLENSIHTEKQARTESAKRAGKLRQLGPKFVFHRDTEEPEKKPAKSYWISKAGVIFALLVFTAIFILSYFAILCNSFW